MECWDAFFDLTLKTQNDEVQVLSLEEIREQINALKDNTILRIELAEQKEQGREL